MSIPTTLSSSGRKRIKALKDGRVRLSGDVTLRELYEAEPDIELYVEPLSAAQKLSEFLAEGGLGYGSLGNGTFGGQLCSVKSVHGGLEFSYGRGTMPLYNTGYPLQRIMEGTGPDLLDGKFGAASEMIVRARARTDVALDHTPSEAPDLPGANGAESVFFANATAAKVMGLPGAGIVKVRRVGEAGGSGDDAWSKRFVLDALPEGHAKLLVLTQPSGARTLCDAHGADHADGVFLALAVHTGVLVAASAPPAGVEGLAKAAADLPLTWRLGA